jgi:hypothetical protein
MASASSQDELERQAMEWTEAISGESFAGPTFAESLKDGLILCKCVLRQGRAWVGGGGGAPRSLVPTSFCVPHMLFFLVVSHSHYPSHLSPQALIKVEPRHSSDV